MSVSLWNKTMAFHTETTAASGVKLEYFLCLHPNPPMQSTSRPCRWLHMVYDQSLDLVCALDYLYRDIAMNLLHDVDPFNCFCGIWHRCIHSYRRNGRIRWTLTFHVVRFFSLPHLLIILKLGLSDKAQLLFPEIVVSHEVFLCDAIFFHSLLSCTWCMHSLA